MNPYQNAKNRLRQIKRGASKGPEKSRAVQHADKIRALTDEEFEQIRTQGELQKFLGSQHKTCARNTEGLRMLAIAGGKREFLGTTVGDAVKLIHNGRIGDVAAMGRAGTMALSVLSAANIINTRTRSVDRRAIEESLKKGRLVRGKL